MNTPSRMTMPHAPQAPQSENEMREFNVPRMTTPVELQAFVDELISREHDYGTCVYAMSLAATAAFNLVAHKLGVTGFQASCADMDIIRRTRCIDGPFMLLRIEDALYPQYDLPAKVREYIAECDPWLGEQARLRLAQRDNAHPNVVAHWQRLSEANPPAEPQQ